MTPSLTPPLFLQVLQSITSANKLLIAYSGGLDSHVLLHLISECPELKARALHIHHGLQKEADNWVDHCQIVCEGLSIPFQVDYLDLQVQKGESLEEVARKGRYLALQSSLQSDEVLLTAHHQNDQAETLLLQLFRGAGVQGLASMPLITDFSCSQLARPLLAESRPALEKYAEKHKLIYIEDPSNQDLSFDRNFLRHQIFPELKDRWPGIDRTIARAAGIQAETKELLDEIAAKDLKNSGTKDKNILPIAFLLKLSAARQKLLIRYWITVNNCSLPSSKKLDHILDDVVKAQKDAQPLVEWQGTQIRRYQDKLYIMQPLSDHDNTQVIHWDCVSPLEIASLGISLQPEVLHQQSHSVTVRFRQGGEKISHIERGIHISLKKHFQKTQVPPWLRSRIPLIYCDDELIQIIGKE